MRKKQTVTIKRQINEIFQKEENRILQSLQASVPRVTITPISKNINKRKHFHTTKCFARSGANITASYLLGLMEHVTGCRRAKFESLHLQAGNLKLFILTFTSRRIMLCLMPQSTATTLIGFPFPKIWVS